MLARSILFAAALSFVSSSCSSSELSCSAANVTDTVKTAAAKALAHNDDFVIFDAKKSTFAVTGIRTVVCDERTCMCKAAVTVSLELQDIFRQVTKSPDADGYARVMVPRYGQKEASFDVAYTAELTDDGQDVYVTLHGM